ncbi:MAG: HipA N-terminal domain-containing protein [Bacteroidales bacterium]|nr:HipA N-terminal domain-containing protein [Bacteroidales bacterium]
MRCAEVYRNGNLAGTLIETDQGRFEFTYDNNYYNDSSMPAISLTLPKSQQTYTSEYLFPFFYNMLSEGTNRLVQSKHLRIDEQDFFGLLLATAKYDTTGAITIKQID